MQTAKVFMNGRSQAVRLPKDCRLEGDEVAVTKLGDSLLLQPYKKSWLDVYSYLQSIEAKLPEREDLPVQERDFF